MGKKEITVYLETITPLWTGDAWQENNKVRSNSILGGLRFWFSVYWKVVKREEIEKLNDDGVPTVNLEEIAKEESFRVIALKHLQYKNVTNDFDEEIDKVLEELKLPVPSRIFGCTGWRSRVNIRTELAEEKSLQKVNLEFKYPDDINSKFWINKNIFKEKNESKLYTNVRFKLKTSQYWWENYLEEFFKFFSDKIVLMGGKASFGFGFVKMKVEGKDEGTTEHGKNKIVGFDNMYVYKAEKIDYNGSKDILGFNLKYYLRKKEKVNIRNKQEIEEHFGKQKKASKVYVSNLLKEDNNSIYLVIFNNPFDINPIFKELAEEYFRVLEELRRREADKNV
ncbi:CRISPR-associated protein Cmr1 [Thermohydrogenium kirishiense]|uniref:type III-B CRISPR module RAMP protein Cmr1 n=1 Tax=Thermoanaerobacterium thermosaccharolyticum TaxID=1517 RepID=UPI00104918DD|nr:CRISPR-associated protein Cmr1 [Thermohydrogenium kirishiense]